MSVERYAARRHNISNLAAQIIASRHERVALTAKLGGHTPAEWAGLLRNGLKPPPARIKSGVRAAAKPAKPGGKAQTATQQQRRLRLAEADAALAPAPKKRGPLPAAEACTSITVGGSSFDRAPAVRATDGGAPATSAAAKRMNVLATHRQVSARLRRADAASRW
jgi:hypothetical protein